SSIRELRDEAIACLALTDLRPGQAFGKLRAGDALFAFDGAFLKYAKPEARGVAIYRLGAAEPIVRIKEPSAAAQRLKLSPDGRFLAVGFLKSVEIRRADTGKIVSTHPGKALRLEFTADSSRIAIGYSDGTFALCDVAGGRTLASVHLG